MRTLGIAVACSCLVAAVCLVGDAALSAPSSPALSPTVQPICGAPGYALLVSYRFGKRAKLLPGETPIRSRADMVNLGWHYEAPWYYGSTYFNDFSKADSPLGPNYVFEDDDLALVARHDKSGGYTKDPHAPHVSSGQFLTSLTVQPPAIVEFMVETPAGRGMWPALWLYDCNSGKHDSSELDVLEAVYNAPLGQGDDPSRIYQYDHGPQSGRTIEDPGGLDAHGYWQPHGSLAKGDPGSDFSKRWTAFSVWWQLDRESKYVDNKLGITRAFKWTGGGWPNILVGNQLGGWSGTILPETFKGDNATFRIKWVRVFKPVRWPSEEK
jgi:beta-glucanase (GH16 family)